MFKFLQWFKRQPKPFDRRDYISDETLWRIEALFPPEQREEVIVRLAFECGRNVPHFERQSPVELERLQFAALKYSQGEMALLRRGIAQAQRDWRDLFVGVGFAAVDAHRQWKPEKRYETIQEDTPRAPEAAQP